MSDSPPPGEKAVLSGMSAEVPGQDPPRPRASGCPLSAAEPVGSAGADRPADNRSAPPRRRCRRRARRYGPPHAAGEVWQRAGRRAGGRQIASLSPADGRASVYRITPPDAADAMPGTMGLLLTGGTSSNGRKRRSAAHGRSAGGGRVRSRAGRTRGDSRPPWQRSTSSRAAMPRRAIGETPWRIAGEVLQHLYYLRGRRSRTCGSSTSTPPTSASASMR